jgi:hypothetical protein
MYEALTMSDIKNLPELFDVCYKQGIADAYRYDDINAATEFYDLHHNAVDSFGRLCEIDDLGRISDTRNYDFTRWCTLVSGWASKCRAFTVLSRVLDYARCYNLFTGVIYVISMDFYLQGIAHYIKNPNKSIVDVIYDNPHARLQAANRAKKRKQRTLDDYQLEVIDFINHRIDMLLDLPEDERKKHSRFSIPKYRMFQNAYLSCIKQHKEKLRLKQIARFEEKQRKEEKDFYL